MLPPAWEGSWFEAGSGPQGVTIGSNTISHKVGGSGGAGRLVLSYGNMAGINQIVIIILPKVRSIITAK